MRKLSLKLLGRFRASLDEEALTDFRTSKVQALLVYLAVEAESHRRERLTGLLWPGMPERSARHNLRQVIYYLRAAIPELGSGAGEVAVPFLLANRQTIQLNPDAEVVTDISRFDALLDGVQEHDHIELLSCRQCGDDLEQATGMYQGDFLSDFYLEDSVEFEEWAQVTRESYRRKMLDALEVLTAVASRGKDFPRARALAERQLEIDNLRESSYRQLMEVLALSGRREEALAVYESCRRLLAEELGMQPARRTTEIHDRIVAGELRFDLPQAQGIRGYELKEEIGQGAYGTIYRAVQPVVHREVAVKVIRRKYADNPEFIRRFEDEAQTIASLEHPFVVPLYDYWRDPEGAFLVMRYLKGGSLLSILENGPWQLEPAARMLDQVSAALQAAHQSGIVHRDIKPANILLDEAGNAYISDFGIAKGLDGERALTAAGAVLGTPDYISPEQILDEQVGPQSDQYSLAAVLFETLTGEKPFGEAAVASLIYKHLNERFPLVSESLPGLNPEIDRILQKASAKRPADRFERVMDLADAFRAAVSGRAVIEAVPRAPQAPLYNPYKGLAAFQEGDADDFFGRDVLVDQLVARLSPSGASSRDFETPGKGRFLALVGPSGSGKSSAVKAGLIPALRSGAVPGSEKWFVAEMVPGSHPFDELETALWSVAVDPPPGLVEPMQRDVRGLLRTLRRILPNESGAQLLLVIDQFEELFTLAADAAQRDFFLESLLAALTAPRSPLRVVITLRADFYDRPLQQQALGRLLKESTEIVLPLSAEELTWAVREPARRVGVALESGLAEAIVADVIDQPGGLPLMQYALTELFERRRGKMMTQAAYVEIGGVPGAPSSRAEDLIAELDPGSQDAARQLFLRLVTLGEGVEDTRRRVLRPALETIDEARMPAVIDAFGAARLLTFDRDPLTRAPTVEVAHEALLHAWGRLRGWLEENREALRLQQGLSRAAAEWRAGDKDGSFLLRGARLARMESWEEQGSVAMTDEEREFLSASIAAREARQAEIEVQRQRELEAARRLAETESRRAEEQAAAARRLRGRALLLAGVLAVTAILAFAAVIFGGQANRNANLARSRELAAASSLRRDSDPELGLLLAVEAMSAAHTSEAEQALHMALLNARLRMRLEGHQAAIQRVAYSPDGKTIALGSHGDERLTLWDSASGEMLHELPLNQCCWGLFFDGESRQLAAAEPGANFSLAIWDVATGKKTSSLALPVSAIAIGGFYLNPDWTQVAVFLQDGDLAIWDLTTGERLFDLPGHTGFVELEFSNDGRRLVSYDNREDGSGRVQVWDAQTGELLQRLDSDFFINDHAVSPDGQQVALAVDAGDAGWEVHVWEIDVTDGEGPSAPVFRLAGNPDTIRLIDFSADGGMLASASLDGTSRIWDLVTGETFLVLPHGVQVRSVVFHPDGHQLLSSDIEGVARVWDISPVGATESLSWVPNDGFIVFNSELSPDGRTLVTGGTPRLWEMTNGSLIQDLVGHEDDVWSVAFHPDGGRVATASLDGTARIWDAATGEELLRLEGHGESLADWIPGVLGVDYHPAGDRLATAGADGTARIWDAASGETLHVLQGHTVDLSAIAFSPDGSYLASDQASGENLNVLVSPTTVFIWETDTGQPLFSFDAGHGQRVWELAFSPDGRFLATSGTDAAVKLWALDYDAGRAVLKATLTNHTNMVLAVTFSPDGRRLASATPDEVRLWDLRAFKDGSGEGAITELLVLPGGPSALLFSPDGSELITSGRDGLMRVYLLDPQDLLSLAYSRLTRWWAPEECRQFLHTPDCPPEPGG